MNQTFDIRRFGNYLNHQIRFNWIISVFLLIGTIGATICSILHVDPVTCLILYFTFGLFYSALPSREMQYTSGWHRTIMLPASTIEKYTAHCILALSPMIISFSIHALCGATGLIDMESCFSDGFQPKYIAWSLCIIWLVSILSNYQLQKTPNGNVSTLGLMFICCFYLIIKLLEGISDISTIPTTIAFGISLILFVVSYHCFKRRRVIF